MGHPNINMETSGPSVPPQMQMRAIKGTRFRTFASQRGPTSHNPRVAGSTSAPAARDGTAAANTLEGPSR